MLARTNKGDLSADLDGDENDHSLMSVDLFCVKHYETFVKYLHEDKYKEFQAKVKQNV